MTRNVYDFDGTIFAGDSTIEFYKYCIFKYPRVIFSIPFAIIGFIFYKLRIWPKEIFKEHFYQFLKEIPDVDDAVKKFWEKNINRIELWYLIQQQANDLLISASPEFLLKPLCERIGINYLVASKVDPCTGKLLGPNCWGEEKVIQMDAKFPEINILEFYSDSLSDLPLAKKAQNSFFVKDGSIYKWEV